MPGGVKPGRGLANDELGYLVPKSQQDAKRPFTCGSDRPFHGGLNSSGPDAVLVLCRTVFELSQAAAGGGPPDANAASEL